MSMQALHELGQSVWLDYIRRHLLRSGQLAALIRDGLRGITSNPSIFEKAIAGSTDYTDSIVSLAHLTADEIYEHLAIDDIRDAADQLRPVYDSSDGGDGFVSLEVSPLLAHDTDRTVAEARRLWGRVQRANLMVKVPATREGIPAIRALTSEGINVNVTLLFSREVYAQVWNAYVEGLEALVARGGDPTRVASVASFFVSRIDVAVDRLLETTGQGTELLGKTAIANARLAYQDWKARVADPRWQALAAKGTRPQRLLWASTSTKDPRLPDVYYVEALIGADTVDTIPPATLDAFREHGRVQATLEQDLEGARAVIDTLPRYGISLTEVTDRLTAEGVESFRVAFAKLLAAVEARRREARVERVSCALPQALQKAVDESVADWDAGDKVRRLWARDATLWTGEDEAKWLSWLTVADREHGDEGELAAFADEVRQRGFTHVALLGMGGSSLCPDVLSKIFGSQAGFPELRILDSTDPAQVRHFEEALDLAHTLFIVSSKSGTTLEPNVLADHFYARVGRGDQFVAITDPDRPHLQQVATERGYWKVFFGEPGIGGRYSALSQFGLVPAAAMGIDIDAFLDSTLEMVHACAASVPARDNPGVILGAVLGTLASGGRDKVTLVASPALAPLGAWIEQLLAESTGKQGHGLIPVDREPVGAPEVYGDDRLFVHLRLDADPGDETAIEALRRAGQPVVRLSLPSIDDLGQAFFLCEMATAVAGSILHINAFDQPDVEASKVEARRLTDAFERTGTLEPEAPIITDGPLTLFATPEETEALGRHDELRDYLRSHLDQLHPGDYFATLAYIENSEPHRRVLDAIRTIVRDARHVATCVGFGPRFLHSTGQVYKGGPNTGLFLEVTHDPEDDVSVEGKPYTFGVVEAAQARGDFEILGQRHRRALRVHVSGDLDAGLQALAVTMAEALT